MSKSKNDFSIAGYRGRVNLHAHHGRYDAMYKLINPVTTRPYTNAEVVTGLQQCKSAYPQLENTVDLWLKKVFPKAVQHPYAEYTISQRGKTATTQGSCWNAITTKNWNRWLCCCSVLFTRAPCSSAR